MGRYMAAELLDSDFFEGVDVIIPIPLHKRNSSSVTITKVNV